jgi:uncharacterized protein YdaU (DUF1376 family)
MHYYKRNLGDYAKKAGRLTMLQHGAYTLLIDSCYDREQFPTLEEALEWTWAFTTEEIDAVQFVLNRFFKLNENNQYVQERIVDELQEYHAKANKNQQIAIERETKRKENNTNRARNVNEPSPNHKPLTINQEPITNIDIYTPPAEKIPPNLFNEFLNVRILKKSPPFTELVWEGLKKQAVAAQLSAEEAMRICVEKGWATFDASWVPPPKNPRRNTI